MTNQIPVERLDEPEGFPEWLGISLINNDLPWEIAQPYNVEEFLEKYTLHDSYWVTLHHDVAQENYAILVIEWDVYWLPDEIAQSTPIVAEWPLLFIKLEDVKQISTLGYEKLEVVAIRGIATAEFEEINGKNVFVIHDHFGGSVEIVYSGGANFLAFDRKKTRLII
jgi:hypothetical protein